MLRVGWAGKMRRGAQKRVNPSTKASLITQTKANKIKAIKPVRQKGFQLKEYSA
jgi:hypothetical protein